MLNLERVKFMNQSNRVYLSKSSMVAIIGLLSALTTWHAVASEEAVLKKDEAKSISSAAPEANKAKSGIKKVKQKKKNESNLWNDDDVQEPRPSRRESISNVRPREYER